MAIANEAVAEYLPRIETLARRFNGVVPGCEYDDLVQEASEKLVILMLAGEEVTSTALINSMRDWVRKCALRGLSDELPEDYAA